MKNIVVTGLVVCIALGLYAAAYLANVQQAVRFHVPSDRVDDKYRIGGEFSRWVFWPANQLDRQLRPEAWRALSFLEIPMN